MTTVKKGHLSFMKFLDSELPRHGLVHWYEASSPDDFMAPDRHHIGLVSVETSRMLGLFTREKETRAPVAEITCEPGSPLYAGLLTDESPRTQSLSMIVMDADYLEPIKELGKAFEASGFELPVNIIH